MRTRLEGDYEIDDDFGRLDFRMLEGWLTASYWSPGIRLPEIVQGARNSALNLGCFWKGDGEGKQVGYLRVASDKTRFAYIMDVYVDEAHRRRGLARARRGGPIASRSRRRLHLAPGHPRCAGRLRR